MTEDKRKQYQPIPTFSEWMNGVSEVRNTLKGQMEAIRQASPDAFTAATESAKKWAAVDTGAIERLYTTDRGFTFSVGRELHAVAFVHSRRDESFAAHLEDQLNGYDYVLDIVTRSKPLGEAQIRELHAVLCKQQDTYTVIVNEQSVEKPLQRGEYKSEQNHVTLKGGVVHEYCPVERTKDEMARLIDETRTDRFQTGSFVAQAAYVHHCFTVIHPFADGNGRVSRALASLFFYRELSMPLVVFADQRDEYFDALSAADRGDTKVFFDFVMHRAEDSVRLVKEAILAETGPDLDSITEDLKKYLRQSGRTVNEVYELTTKLEKLCSERLRTVAQEKTKEFEEKVSVSVTKQVGTGSAQTLDRANREYSLTHQPVKVNQGAIQLAATTNSRSGVKPVSVSYVVMAPKEHEDDSCAILARVAVTDGKFTATRGIEVPLRDLELNETPATLRQILGSWADREVAGVLTEIYGRLRQRH